MSSEQRKIVEAVTARIRELLKNDACRELIQGILDDKDFRIRQAVPELDRLEKNRGITYFHGAEFNAGAGPAIASVRGTYTGFGRSSPRIVLGFYYFQNSVGPAGKGVVEYWDISRDEAESWLLFMNSSTTSHVNPTQAPTTRMMCGTRKSFRHVWELTGPFLGNRGKVNELSSECAELIRFR